jgi:ferredoxin-NADP reductase
MIYTRDMPEVSVENIEDIGTETIALTLNTPSDFEAYPGQFVLIRGEIDDKEESSYYTISSPTVNDTFEVTVAVDQSEGVLGPWLADHEVGDKITIEGPFGDIQYRGNGNVVVFAAGPGIGPAVGIAERAMDANNEAVLIYYGTDPAHSTRLETLSEQGTDIVLTEDVDQEIDDELFASRTVYIFGFDEFATHVRDVLTDNDIDLDKVEIENFGPE